jgi:hypothetical protein
MRSTLASRQFRQACQQVKRGSALLPKCQNLAVHDKPLIAAPSTQKTARELVSVCEYGAAWRRPKKLTVICRLQAALQRFLLSQKRFSDTPTHFPHLPANSRDSIFHCSFLIVNYYFFLFTSSFVDSADTAPLFLLTKRFFSGTLNKNRK